MSMLGHYVLLFEKLNLVKTTPLAKHVGGDGSAHPLESSDDICPAHWPTYPNLPHWDYGVEKIEPDKLRGCIHVGAWDCAEMGCYVPMFGENVVWIEANKNTYDTITKPRAEAYNHKSYNCALGDIEGKKVSFNVLPNADSSSLREVVGSSSYYSVEMKLKTLDNLIHEEKIDMNNINFLNIDAEGFEYEILVGMKDNIDKIDYLFFESSLIERHKGAKNFKQMHEYVTELGFKLVKVSDSFNTLKWGDVFYKRV